ncbi:unnamed protein product [Brassica oleracea var. botrytis]
MFLLSVIRLYSMNMYYINTINLIFSARKWLNIFPLSCVIRIIFYKNIAT